VNRIESIFAIAILIAFIVFAIVGPIYACNRQVEIYRQQGIEISAFDVFMGVRPNEHVIQIKEN
jgi:hypothetical protein